MKIKGTGNDGKYHRYYFKKEKHFKKKFIKLMLELDFKKENFDDFLTYETREGEEKIIHTLDINFDTILHIDTLCKI